MSIINADVLRKAEQLRKELKKRRTGHCVKCALDYHDHEEKCWRCGKYIMQNCEGPTKGPRALRTTGEIYARLIKASVLCIVLALVGKPPVAHASGAPYPTPPMPYVVLDTTHTVSVKMGEGVTTTAPTFAVAYMDSQETLWTPGAAEGSFTTSYVSAVAAPAAGNRNISSIVIVNADTVTHTLYVIRATSAAPTTPTSFLLDAYSVATGATVTLGTAGVVSSTPLTFPITVPQGGTGDVTLTNHGVMLGQGTAAVVVSSAGASGALLLGQGASADPTFNAMSGDATITNTGSLSLAASNTHQTSIANLATVGTITSGTWNAAAVAAAFGGTGQTTYTIGDLLYASASNALSKLADVTAGSYLRSGGAGVAPGYSAITIPNTATNKKIWMGNGTNVVESTPTFPGDASAAAGKLIVSDGTNWVPSTPTYPNASATLNKWIKSDGTNFVSSTSTLSDTWNAGDIAISSGGGGLSGLSIGGAGKFLAVNGSGTAEQWAYPMQEQGKSSLFTAGASDNMSLFVCDVSGGGFTATLPSVGTVTAGYCLWFRVSQHGLSTSATGTNILTIACNSADGVNGMNALTSTASTLYLCRDGETIGLIANAAGGYNRNQGWSVITYHCPNNAQNFVDNPCGVVKQRPANSVPAINVWTYGTVDRWALGSTVAPGAAWTIDQDTSTGTTPTGYSFGLTSATITAGPVVLRQVIEAKDAIALNGRVAVFTANVYQDTGSAVNYIMNIYPNTAADNATKSATTGAAISSGNLGANQSVATATFTTICSGPIQMGTSTKNGFVLEIKTAAVSPTTKHFLFTDVCLQPGTVSLPWVHRDYRDELARCQRECWVIANPNASKNFGMGGCFSTSSAQMIVGFPVTMRTAPTLTFSGTAGNIKAQAFDGTGSAVATSAPTLSNATVDCATISFANTGATWPAAKTLVQFFWGTGSTSDFIVLDCDF